MVLYRFTKKKYLECFIQGNISFAIASSYNDDGLTDAQKDDEQTRSFTLNPQNIHLEMNNMPMKGVTHFEVNQTVSDKHGKKGNYYLLPFTLFYDDSFYSKFKVDSCIKVFNVDEFMSRLDKELKRIDWKRYAEPVKYYDDKQPVSFVDNKQLIFSKSNKYEWQREYRIIICSPNQQDIKEQRVNIDIGDISDIAEFVE